MKKFLILALLTFTVISCSKSEDEKTVNTVQNQKIEVTGNYMNLVTLKLSYNTEPATYVPKKKIFYRKKEDQIWTELPILLTAELKNLEIGKRYYAKGVLEVDGKLTETETISFVTKAFDLGSSKGGERTDLYNRECNIYGFYFGAEFSKLPLTAYLKIGNDSLKMKSVTKYSDFGLSFVLPDDTQSFFDKDTEYKYNKDYTIGISCGDYYTEITASNKHLQNPYKYSESNGEKYYLNNMTLYNKMPYIYKLKHIQRPSICSSNNKQFLIVDFDGFFWGYPDLSSNPYNKPKDYKITITNVKHPELIKTFNINNYKKGNSDFSSCGEEGFNFEIELDNYYAFHSANILRLWLDKSYFASGDYTAKIDFTDESNKIFESNKFAFKLE
jgi:hypothetical protein